VLGAKEADFLLLSKLTVIYVNYILPNIDRYRLEITTTTTTKRQYYFSALLILTPCERGNSHRSQTGTTPAIINLPQFIIPIILDENFQSNLMPNFSLLKIRGPLQGC
jgi:hypothetical protein